MAIDRSRSLAKSDEAGFTLVEVMVSMAVLAVGLLSLLGMFAYAVSSMQLSQEDLIAKQKARETLESLYAARNAAQISFDQINTVPNGGIFVEGAQPLLSAGPDGIIGTADDTDIEELILPGPDGKLGTSDDIHQKLTNYTRQIEFAQVLRADKSVNLDLRQAIVTITYRVPQFGPRTYKAGAYISRYR